MTPSSDSRSASSARDARDFTVPALIAEGLCDLALAEPFAEPQHHHVLLTDRQPTQRCKHLQAPVGVVRARRHRRQVRQWDLHPAPNPPAAHRADHRLADVRVTLRVSDDVPTPVTLDQRRLHAVLSRRPVPAQQKRQPPQVAVPLTNVRVKLQPVR